MSTLKAGTVQTDTVAAKDGQGIPNNLRSLTPFCYGTIQDGVLVESFNVSSITIVSQGIQVKMMSAASSVNYSISAARDGNEIASEFSICYFSVGAGNSNAKTAGVFTLIPKLDGTVNTNAGEVSFMVFDKGQTV